MREQHGPLFTPVARRTSATEEELTERQRAVGQQTAHTTRHPVQRLTNNYPPASPHRAGHFAGIHPEDAPYLFQEVRHTRRSPVAEVDEEDLDYPSDPPRRRTTVIVRAPAKPTRRLPRTRFHPLVFLGIGLFIMIIGWLAFSALSSWWTVQLDDWHYGRPRTYQTDAVVGHEDSANNPSHFIAMNLNRKVIVIEIPGGDTAHAQIYLGPTLFGSGQDLLPITLSFEDRNGDGKPDLNIHIADHIIVFLNNGKTFVSPQQH